MTVKELIEHLVAYPGDLNVVLEVGPTSYEIYDVEAVVDMSVPQGCVVLLQAKQEGDK